MCVLYFGWPNQPSSGTMKILDWNVIFLLEIFVIPEIRNLQYIGETKRRLKDRFNEHRRTIDNPNNKSKPTTAAEHFLSSPNHTANDMLLIPIEKIFSNRDSIRKAREAFLIQKGKTIDPAGLNIREETY